MMPRSTINSPTGFGADWGTYYLGVSAQERGRYVKAANGLAWLGAGIGDAKRLIGIEAMVMIEDLQPLGEDGTVSVKAHHRLSDHVGIAVGATDIAAWGPTGTTPSYYLSTSTWLPLSDGKFFSQITVHAGLGNGRFVPLTFVDRERAISPFAALALRVWEPINLIANWTGQDLFSGLSVAPFKDIPLFVGAGFADLLGHVGDRNRFYLSISYASSFLEHEEPYRYQ